MSDKAHRQVWPVSTGQYPDYCVIMVCESEEIAQRYADYLNDHKTPSP